MEHPDQSKSGAIEQGILAGILRYFGSVVRHLEALFALAQVELREAAGLYLRIAVFLVIGLICLVFGYVFCLLFLIFFLEFATGLSWVFISLILGGVHLLVAAICAWRIRDCLRTATFETLRSEIRKDVSSLRQTPPPSESGPAALPTPNP